MHERTLLEQAQALQDGEVSSVELTQFYLNRIQAHDESLNSFVTVTGAQASGAGRGGGSRPVRR